MAAARSPTAPAASADAGRRPTRRDDAAAGDDDRHRGRRDRRRHRFRALRARQGRVRLRAHAAGDHPAGLHPVAQPTSSRGRGPRARRQPRSAAWPSSIASAAARSKGVDKPQAGRAGSTSTAPGCAARRRCRPSATCRRSARRSTVYDFYQDIRAYGRGHEEYYERASKGGTVFVRYAARSRRRSPRRRPGDGAPVIVRCKDGLTWGEEVEAAVDLVVLAVGMVPADVSALVDEPQAAGRHRPLPARGAPQAAAGGAGGQRRAPGRHQPGPQGRHRDVRLGFGGGRKGHGAALGRPRRARSVRGSRRCARLRGPRPVRQECAYAGAVELQEYPDGGGGRWSTPRSARAAAPASPSARRAPSTWPAGRWTSTTPWWTRSLAGSEAPAR